MGRSKKRKSILTAIIVIVVVCAAGLFAAYTQFTGGEKNSAATYTVHSETFTNIIEIAGTISAANEQNLQAAGDGTVTAVYVKEGDRVRKGQIILQMDDSEQRYNLARHDYEMEQKQISGSPKELQLMAVQREVLLQRIKDRQISAGFDGVIAALTVFAGDVFEAKDVAGIIIDRGYLAATVEVAETDAPKLRPGQKVSLNFPANGNQPIEGRVYSFPAVASKSSRGASVVKAEIRVDNPPDIILPNYSFTGEIEISPPETLLLVERQAIGFRRMDEGETGETGERRPIAFAEKILKDGAAERVEVQVEPYGDGFVKIISGLSEGDELAAQEISRLSGWNGQNRQGGNIQNQNRQQNPMMPMMPGSPPSGGRGGPRR
jgi:multidrug efflux pump subunit AcrA (membrane-fusion protein)